MNKNAATGPIKLGDELWKILSECKQYHAMTNGYFDITLKDYTQVVLDVDKRTVYFKDPNIQIDLVLMEKGMHCRIERLLYVYFW